MLTDSEKQYEKYRTLVGTKPTSGDILTTKNDKRILLRGDMRNGQLVFFCNAAVDDEGTGWYLSDGGRGLRVLISPECRDKLLERFGSSEEVQRRFPLAKVRVIRQTIKETGLICEVIE